MDTLLQIADALAALVYRQAIISIVALALIIDLGEVAVESTIWVCTKIIEAS